MRMSVHLIKLVAGVPDLQSFYEWQQRELFDYHGHVAVPCWTRYKPRQAEDILRSGGSIYRVIKNRIQCRHKILGFEMVERGEEGMRCMIVQDAQMIETMHMPRRAFQGWRYFKHSDIPPDRGVYDGSGLDDALCPEMEAELKDAGLL